MRWRSPRTTTVVLALLPLGFYGSWRVLWGIFSYLLDHHALRAESPYFLPACVACAITPWLGAALYVFYQILCSRMRRKAEEDADEASDARHSSHDG